MTEEIVSDSSDQASDLRSMVEAQRKARNHGDPATRILAVTSGKGGVGKSTISVNLAIALSQMGARVLLFDADLGLANLNVLLGVIPKFNLYHVIKGQKSLKEIIVKVADNVDIIAGASGYSSLANMDENDREVLIEAFSDLSGYDILLIDTGAGVGHNVTGFLLPADDIIVITTPEPTSITDAYGIIKSIVIEDPNKYIRLVVNRADSSAEGRKVAEKIINISSQFLNVQVESAGFIYNDENVAKSIRKQKPFYQLFPTTKASSCLKVVAQNLLNNENAEIQLQKSGISYFFKKLFAAS